jgi:hypothetical protein
MLTGPIADELLQSIAGQGRQIIKRIRGVQASELNPCLVMQCRGKQPYGNFAAAAVVDVLRRTVPKAADWHRSRLYRIPV